MKICPNCRHTEAVNLKYCPQCASHTVGFLMVDADTCQRCRSWKTRGYLCKDCYGTPVNPKIPPPVSNWETSASVLSPEDEVEYVLSGNKTEELETRLYDLTRKQNRTTWENKELARLRAEWKAKKGYDYV